MLPKRKCTLLPFPYPASLSASFATLYPTVLPHIFAASLTAASIRICFSHSRLQSISDVSARFTARRNTRLVEPFGIFCVYPCFSPLMRMNTKFPFVPLYGDRCLSYRSGRSSGLSFFRYASISRIYIRAITEVMLQEDSFFHSVIPLFKNPLHNTGQIIPVFCLPFSIFFR